MVFFFFSFSFFYNKMWERNLTSSKLVSSTSPNIRRPTSAGEGTAVEAMGALSLWLSLFGGLSMR